MSSFYCKIAVSFRCAIDVTFNRTPFPPCFPFLTSSLRSIIGTFTIICVNYINNLLAYVKVQPNTSEQKLNGSYLCVV